MGKLFNLDSPIMQFLNRVADLMILNIITLICCIPVITAGASITAMHYVLLKMVRGDDGYIVQGFFKSFRENFVQATVEWLIMLVMIIVFVLDFVVIRTNQNTFPAIFRYSILGVSIVVWLLMQFVLPLQSHFANPVKTTFKNSVLISIAHFPRTLAIALISLAPLALLLLSFQLTPFVFMFGLSAPGIACAYIYSPVFMKFEPAQEENLTEENWVVPEDNDEIDEAFRNLSSK